MTHFGANLEFDGWPKNLPGKPTQAAVFGLYHREKGKILKILCSGQFSDLQPAMHWAAMQEVEAIRNGKWWVASRVLWQHELTAEQAVEVAFRHSEPQLDRALQSIQEQEQTESHHIDLGRRSMPPMANYDQIHETGDLKQRAPDSGLLSPEMFDAAFDPDNPIANFLMQRGEIAQSEGEQAAENRDRQ